MNADAGSVGGAGGTGGAGDGAPEIALIAAVARNGAIGRDNGLIFREPADGRHFRAVTMGCPVVMGRKTWESLPPRFRPLPGRANIVLSRDPAWRAEGATPAATLDAALAACPAAPRVFVIGGAALYALALPRARRLVLTEIDAELPGDTWFPRWNRDDFEEIEREHQRTADGIGYDFVTYCRR